MNNISFQFLITLKLVVIVTTLFVEIQHIVSSTNLNALGLFVNRTLVDFITFNFVIQFGYMLDIINSYFLTLSVFCSIVLLLLVSAIALLFQSNL